MYMKVIPYLLQCNVYSVITIPTTNVPGTFVHVALALDFIQVLGAHPRWDTAILTEVFHRFPQFLARARTVSH